MSKIKKTHFILLSLDDIKSILKVLKDRKLKDKIKEQISPTKRNKKPVNQKEYHQKYYIMHREQIREQQKKYRLNWSDEYYRKVQEREKEYGKKWREKRRLENGNR